MAPGKKKKTDEDAPRKKAGRPAHRHIVRGRESVKQKWAAIIKAVSPSPQTPPAASSTGGTVLTGDAARATRLATQSYGTRPERKESKGLPIFLDNLSGDRRRKLIATIPTEECPQWFDAQVRGKSLSSAPDNIYVIHSFPLAE